MNRFLFATTLLIMLLSCNKDKKAANKLSGTWNATSYIINDAGETSSTYNFIEAENRSITIEIIACDIETNSDCDCHLQMVDFEGYVTEVSYTYSISDNGTVLFLEHSEGDYNETWTIALLTKEKLKMKRIRSNRSTIEMLLTKV